MNEFMQTILPIVATLLGAVLTALSGYVITYINKKNKDLQANADSNMTKKYMDMVTKTITDSVLMVNNTYVDTLKKNNAFTKEAQEQAFKMCFDNVMGLLTDDTIKYLNEITTDATKYLTTSIEATVKEEKPW